MDQVALQSMTGFGKANGQFQDKKISVEVRSLNSKGLDLNLKIPSSYRDLETPVRKLVTDALMRGKMDLGIYIESQQHQVSGLINESVATAYFEKLKALNDTWGTNTQDYLALVLRMPDVLNSQLIVPFEQERVAQVKERIQKGLASIDESRIDANRLEQEMIYYVEKLDISEEKQRLQQHLNYFTETLNQEASGKKLGFIAQEMGREINTLGSKCNHSEIQRRVVIMKDHLEKIKEQVLNAL